MPNESEIIISVKNLNILFGGSQPFHAVSDVSFEIAAGKTLALIGQSGSGKSITSLALMGLLPKNATITGSIQLNNSIELSEMPNGLWPEIRGEKIGMIFQEPMTALNPVKTCGYQLIESIRAHQDLSAKEAKVKALNWFEKVRLPNPLQFLRRYPHQLSGGQKQRVMIAMAMCNHPSLLIADEPTTALDVTVQKEIIQLMQELQATFNTALLFITHDIALAKTITPDFLVLEKGKVLHTGFPQQAAAMLNEGIAPESGTPLLKVNNLEVLYPQNMDWLGKTTSSITAVDNVSFELFKGETLGLVGESGCGKSTLSRTILGLQQATSGTVLFESQNVLDYSAKQWRTLRKDIQIIFQDPYASLNQRMKVGDALAEPMLIHKLANKQNVKKHVENLLETVQLPISSASKYPHEFSGGQRQRICIARALAVQPKLVVCDESVAALDVHIQEQILELLSKLQKERGLTYLFITHDLNVIRRISNRIMVMEKGKIVEEGTTASVISNPQHNYTKKLLAAIPG